jgi:endonuclease III
MSFNQAKMQALRVLKLLKDEYPEAQIAIAFGSPFQLLIATILSAQCTDERVNRVTKSLFKKYKSPADFVKADIAELEKDIFSTGFYKQKAKHIAGCCKMLIEKYDGKVPADLEKLIELPGVGRKTASVVSGNGFGIPALAVDTHVKRLSNLLGLVSSDDPEVIESELKTLLPDSEWTLLSHLLATHGRMICIARHPRCNECSLARLCPSFTGIIEISGPIIR